MIEVKCSHCNRLHKVKEEHGGRTAKCSCGTRFNIPSVGTELIVAHEEASASRAPMQAQRRETKACPLCGEDVALLAKKCKHCGEILDPTLRELQEVKRDIKAATMGAPASATLESPQAAKSLTIWGWVSAVVFPFAGIVLGVINIVKGRIGHGVGQIIVSLIMFSFWPAFIEGFEKGSRR